MLHDPRTRMTVLTEVAGMSVAIATPTLLNAIIRFFTYSYWVLLCTVKLKVEQH